MKTFPSSLDRIVRVIPYCIMGLAVIIAIIGFFTIKKSGYDLIILISVSLGPFIMAGLLIAMYYLQPLSVTIDNNGIAINRRAKPVIINFSDIRSVRALSADEMKRCIRTFGNGGLYGYTGQYYNKIMGSMTWYCSQRQNYILIETNRKKIIITPDDVVGFLQELKAIHPALLNPLANN
jgi:Bacterial PH domain